MGILRSEGSSSCNKMPQEHHEPSSPTESSSISKSTKNKIKESSMGTGSSNSMMSLTPPSLSFPSHKLQLPDEDIEIQSPTSALLESLLSDQLDGDFMISSPVRTTLPSPPQNPTSYNYAFNNSHAVSSFSPPRFSSLGFLGNNKGKGMSPLHRVYNSPNNNSYMQMDQSSSLALPAIEDLLEEYQKDEYGGAYSHCFDMPDAASASLDGLHIGSSSSSSAFCTGSRTEQPSSRISRLSQEGDMYQMSSVTANAAVTASTGSASLSQQLQQERHQEKQLQEQNVNNLMGPPVPMGLEQEQDSGLQLVHLLLACAEAVSKEDFMLARKYLHHLSRVVSPLGDSMQRVASCFTEALSARLTATLATRPTSSAGGSAFSSALKPPPFSPFPPNSIEILKIYQILYQACPYIKFAHFTANQAIFEAIEFEERVHVIDLDILQGYQWPAFMQALAARPGGAPFLRITGVGPNLDSVRETGRCLTELAHSLHIPFEFHPVGEQLEDLRPHMLHRRVGEALAVNSVSRLHRVPGHCLGPLLAMIRDQAPNIVTLVEQEASHNGPYFLSRFLEALHFYSAIFDSLDATFPPDSSQRAKVEQYIFAPEILNIVAHEGAERTARHERLDKWRKIMEGKGFKGIPLSGNAVTQSKILLGLYSCDGYRLTEDKGCLLLGWQDRAIIAASAWRC
ncbi:hypothetical protein CDL15_Pgr014399 [Punica granatum]|nr:hypothetical protein CDL15_Pgr014399 [Punica granatum]